MRIASSGSMADRFTRRSRRTAEPRRRGHARAHRLPRAGNPVGRRPASRPARTSGRDRGRLDTMASYCSRHIAKGGRLAQVTPHMIGLFTRSAGSQRLATDPVDRRQPRRRRTGGASRSLCRCGRRGCGSCLTGSRAKPDCWTIDAAFTSPPRHASDQSSSDRKLHGSRCTAP